MSNYIKVARESTFGIPSIVSDDYTAIKVTSISDDVDRGLMIEETIDDYLPTAAYGGALACSGSIDANIRADQLRDLIYSVMGEETGVAYPYTYTYGVPQPVTLLIGEDTGTTLQTTYLGGVISSLNFAFEAKEFVKGTFNFIAKEVQDTTSSSVTVNGTTYAAPQYDSSVTYGNEDPLMFYRATVTIGGDSDVGIKSLSLDIDRGIDTDQYVLGNFRLRRIAMTSQTSATGSITFTEDQYDEYKKALFGSSSSTYISDSNPVGQGTMVIECKTLSGAAGMTITCPVSIYNKASRTFTGKSEIEKTMDFTIINDPDTPFEIEIASTTVTGVTASFTHVEDGLEVTFTDTSTGSPTYWYWDFDDGEYSYEQNPVHTYASGATYDVSLTVDKQTADEDTDTVSVTVSS